MPTEPERDRPPDVRLARVTLAERTAEILRDRIVQGTLAPRTRLIEANLAEELGISRTPIRQALQRLEADGLVLRQGWGLMVAPFDRDVAVETLIMRELLEPFAAAESAPRLTRPELARLASILTEMGALLEPRRYEPVNAAELNMEFHRLLNSRCPYRRIVEVIQVARDGSSAARLYSTYHHDDLHRVHAEHVAIVDAAARARGTGQSGELAELVRDHMGSARLTLLRNISAGEEDDGMPSDAQASA